MGTRTVQFTGDRTGKTELMVPGYGLIHAGDTLEVPEAVAASWTTLHPTAEAGTSKADFSYVTEVPLEPDAETPPAPEDDAPSEDTQEDLVEDPADNASPAEAGSEGETR